MAGWLDRLVGVPQVAPLPEGVLDQSPSDYFGRANVWQAVHSSNVHSIAYFAPARVLGVRFLNDGQGVGAEYRYADVGPEVWKAFQAASSKGQFVWQKLRGNYVYQRV